MVGIFNEFTYSDGSDHDNINKIKK